MYRSTKRRQRYLASFYLHLCLKFSHLSNSFWVSWYLSDGISIGCLTAAKKSLSIPNPPMPPAPVKEPALLSCNISPLFESFRISLRVANVVRYVKQVVGQPSNFPFQSSCSPPLPSMGRLSMAILPKTASNV